MSTDPRPSTSVRLAAIDAADLITSLHDGDVDAALADTVAHAKDTGWWPGQLGTTDPAVVQAALTVLADRQADPDPFAAFPT